MRATPAKFDALTLLLEQYGELDKVSLDEVIGSHTIHELWLKEQESREEEQVLLAKALSNAEISSEESSSRGRGQHHSRGRGRGRGRGQGCNQLIEEDKQTKPFDKSVIQCYTCQRYSHFAYECRNAKKPCDDWAYVVEITAAVPSTSSSSMTTATSSLLMAVVEEVSALLLQGSGGASPDRALWYLDTGAKNHMTECRSFFCKLDESTTRFVKFGDNSRIRIEGK